MRCLLRALFVGAIALLAAGCRPASDDPASAIQRIVLISIDTLRADALGCYGNPHGTSPYIDELAAQGTRFANCIAPAPMTLPSHASMLTGLHPLQQSYLENAALQCGICTPGFLVAAKALLDREPHPSEERIRFWLANNLCRCTGYDKIIRAVMDAANKMQETKA